MVPSGLLPHRFFLIRKGQAERGGPRCSPLDGMTVGKPALCPSHSTSLSGSGFSRIGLPEEDVGGGLVEGEVAGFSDLAVLNAEGEHPDRIDIGRAFAVGPAPDACRPPSSRRP